jgi:uncharacterized protein (DUF1330 family)
MIYITQLIYIKEGKEQTFHDFENEAIPLISKYNGKLLLRIRPDDKSIIEVNEKAPYEIHLVSFENESDLANFMKDPERASFLHLKNESIESAVMYKGVKL